MLISCREIVDKYCGPLMSPSVAYKQVQSVWRRGQDDKIEDSDDKPPKPKHETHRAEDRLYKVVVDRRSKSEEAGSISDESRIWPRPRPLIKDPIFHLPIVSPVTHDEMHIAIKRGVETAPTSLNTGSDDSALVNSRPESLADGRLSSPDFHETTLWAKYHPKAEGLYRRQTPGPAHVNSDAGKTGNGYSFETEMIEAQSDSQKTGTVYGKHVEHKPASVIYRRQWPDSLQNPPLDSANLNEQQKKHFQDPNGVSSDLYIHRPAPIVWRREENEPEATAGNHQHHPKDWPQRIHPGPPRIPSWQLAGPALPKSVDMADLSKRSPKHSDKEKGGRPKIEPIEPFRPGSEAKVHPVANLLYGVPTEKRDAHAVPPPEFFNEYPWPSRPPVSAADKKVPAVEIENSPDLTRRSPKHDKSNDMKEKGKIENNDLSDIILTPEEGAVRLGGTQATTHLHAHIVAGKPEDEEIEYSKRAANPVPPPEYFDEKHTQWTQELQTSGHKPAMNPSSSTSSDEDEDDEKWTIYSTPEIIDLPHSPTPKILPRRSTQSTKPKHKPTIDEIANQDDIFWPNPKELHAFGGPAIVHATTSDIHRRDSSSSSSDASFSEKAEQLGKLTPEEIWKSGKEPWYTPAIVHADAKTVYRRDGGGGKMMRARQWDTTIPGVPKAHAFASGIHRR